MHAKRSVGFVIETDETAEQLVERLRPVLDHERFHNFWCFTPGSDITGRDGTVDPLTVRVREAYDRVRQRNQAKKVRKPQRFQPVIKRPVDNLESRAPIKVNFRPHRKRKPPRNPNRPQYF